MSVKKKRITVYDLARELDISPATVSRSLNNHPNISKKTKQKVFAMAKRMGYGTSFEYKEAASTKKLIALVIPNIESTLYINYTKELQKILSKLEYNLVIFTSNNKNKEEKKIAQQITQLNPSAVIVSLANNSENSKYFKVLNDYNIPWMMFDQVDYTAKVSTICSENILSSKKAIYHLVNNGFKRIAHLAGHPNSSKYNEIVKGYKNGLEENNINFNPDYLIYSDLNKEDISESLFRLLSLETPPNAILVAGSDASIKVHQFLKANSIEIGKEMALISYGFEKSLKYTSPSISHIEINTKELASACVSTVIKLIETNSKYVKNQVIDTKFVIGKSSLKL